jgi:hypothetical protein
MYCLFFSERFDLKPDYSDWHNTAIATATIGSIGFTGFTGFSGFTGFTGFTAIGSIGFRHVVGWGL